ncbi:integrase [Nocardia jiangsuensis]|uniref:Integrase n=1 Tax=Nocardia jiangsuensis TaxID=1691563 RepID=A0ABV8DT44_9NOCA
MQLARELLDESIAPGVPVNAVEDLRSYATHALKTDSGLGESRNAVGKAAAAIKPGITAGSHAYVVLQEHVRRHDAAYPDDWAEEFERGRAADIEGAARRVAAHILDAGYHRSSLHTWITNLRKRPDVCTVPDFLRGAAERLARPERGYAFCVPVTNEPPFTIDAATAPGWLTSTAAAAWKKRHAPDAVAVRHQGGFLLEIAARDVNSAADRARTRIANLQTKFNVGSRGAIQIAPWMWSKDKATAFATHTTNRTLDVRSFERLGLLPDLRMPDYITGALALLQPVRTGAAHIAIMSGWSAIESHLVGPDDADIVAAERFSLIVAASMPRGELTRLAHAYIRENDDALADELRGCPDNLSRARRFQRRLCSGEPLVMGRPTGLRSPGSSRSSRTPQPRSARPRPSSAKSSCASTASAMR